VLYFLSFGKHRYGDETLGIADTHQDAPGLRPGSPFPVFILFSLTEGLPFRSEGRIRDQAGDYRTGVHAGSVF